MERLKLKRWLQLEEKKLDLWDAIKTREIDLIIQCMYAIFVIAGDESIDLEDKEWQVVAHRFAEIIKANSLDRFPPFIDKTFSEKDNEFLFTYPTRLWWMWAYKFARLFGWSLEYIENLDVETALYLYQEFLVDDQKRMEWEWACSQNSIGYDDITKKSVPIKLPRPKWMEKSSDDRILERIKPAKIPKYMMPQGEITRLK